MSAPEGEVIDAEVPAAMILWEGTIQGSDDVARVVATFRVAGPPEAPPGWYVTCEARTFDALAKPAWHEVPRAAGPGDEYEINPDYAIVLETALAATAERMQKVREKVGKKK